MSTTATRHHQRILTLVLAVALPAILAGGALAQSDKDAPTGTNAARPAKNLPEQSSLPSNAPPATTKHTTGATDQSPKVKEMNKAASAKTNREGK